MMHPIPAPLLGLRPAAAGFGALFMMSGVEGQQSVQAMFLFAATACLLLDQHAAPCMRQILRWLRAHPALHGWLEAGRMFS